MSLTKLLKYVTLGSALVSCGVEEPGCSTDHDCKGERVCVQGECVGGNSPGNGGGSLPVPGGNIDYCGEFARLCPDARGASAAELSECRTACTYENTTQYPGEDGLNYCSIIICVAEINSCYDYKLSLSCGDANREDDNRKQFAVDHPRIISCIQKNGWYDSSFWDHRDYRCSDE